MIEAADFVSEASKLKYDFYTGVPCSFLTPFINHIIQNEETYYVSAANEGDAVALAAGASLGGSRSVAMMQNSGLGNAVSPLTSLTYTFRLPILIICTLRGETGINDEPQHELMGKITTKILETMKIPWEIFPKSKAEIRPALARAEKHFLQSSTPYALIMKKGTCDPSYRNAPKKLGTPIVKNEINDTGRGQRPSRLQVLKRIVEKTEREKAVILATTGYTGRELYKIGDRANQFYMVGSMGCVSSLGLGLALVKPDLFVILVDGDGAALMRLGNLATIGAYSPRNLFHFLLDNESHESTGGQETVSGSIDFANVAVSCGYKSITRLNTLGAITERFFKSKSSGPKFIHCKTRSQPDLTLPRPTISPSDLAKRFKEYID